MSRESGEIILATHSLVAGYRKKKVLHGASVEIAGREIVAVIGHNGAGKSTLLRVMFGLLSPWGGTLSVNGQCELRVIPSRMISYGIAYVPQGNRVFTDLTVRENLDLGWTSVGRGGNLGESRERVLSLFPALTLRLGQRAGRLSGGEMQMLAIAMGLMPAPRLLLLDEPSLGLDPGAFEKFARMLQTLRLEHGLACIIVEQKVREILRVADRVYVLRNGIVTFDGPCSSLADTAKLREVYL